MNTTDKNDLYLTLLTGLRGQEVKLYSYKLEPDCVYILAQSSRWTTEDRLRDLLPGAKITGLNREGKAPTVEEPLAHYHIKYPFSLGFPKNTQVFTRQRGDRPGMPYTPEELAKLSDTQLIQASAGMLRSATDERTYYRIEQFAEDLEEYLNSLTLDIPLEIQTVSPVSESSCTLEIFTEDVADESGLDTKVRDLVRKLKTRYWVGIEQLRGPGPKGWLLKIQAKV